MKFSDYAYYRPNVDDFSKKFNHLALEFEKAETLEIAESAFDALNTLRQEYASMASIGQIRHTIDTKDAFYDAENQYLDETGPVIESLTNDFYKKLIVSRFRVNLENKWGTQLFDLAAVGTKTFSPEVLENLQTENKLSSDYVKIKAGAQIDFDGKMYNLSSIEPRELDIDRATRKRAAEAKWSFFAQNSDKIDEIFDNLVKVRHEIAQKLGFKNFVELGYARLMRTDYNAEMVANFRKQVKEYIVPMAQELYARQKMRLGLDSLKYYDESFKFKSGNAKPKGSPNEILRGADQMYADLSAETNAFFQFMRSNELMDLEAKDGKAPGGYCTYIPEYKAPYIFSNFNGTSGDIDVLTHEAGHAFQIFSSRDIGVYEYLFPTLEACEIHSMSMEFFTWQWMPLFFGNETDKYKFSHMSSALLFLPYGVAVDEFQHFVYENPTVTPSVRNQKWREIEEKYLPQRNYDGNAFLEKGGFWQKQSHIFSTPFYYIDYTLAQICAFQFWKKDRENHQTAWDDYVRLCKAGGSQSFLKLVKLANLRSPFEDGCVKSVVGEMQAWLKSIDDTQF